MGKKTLILLAISAAWSGIAAAVLVPSWRVGEAIDGAWAGVVYGNRRAPAAADGLVLVEIDDVSVAQLGPWPWEAGTIAKIFEAPFETARKTVSAVGAEDFRQAEESEKVFQKGLAAFGAVTPITPLYETLPPVEVAEVLNERPGGGQGELTRRYITSYRDVATRLPEWRSLAIRSMASRYRRGKAGGTAEEFVKQALGPYWVNDTELGRTARFWFGQAEAVEAALSSAGVEGFDPEAYGRVEEIDFAYAVAEAKGGYGVAGATRETTPPLEQAIYLFGEKPMARLGFAAMGATRGLEGPRLEGRTLKFTRRSGKVWSTELDGKGRFLPDWTGNSRVKWNERFRRFSAASLVEAANSRRAVWEAYRAHEASLGERQLEGLVDEYEKASAAVNPGLAEEANTRVFSRVRELRDNLMARAATADRAGEEEAVAQARKTLGRLVSIEADYQTLRESLVDAFADRVVLLAPTAAQFAKVRSPWGEEVPPAALDAAIINSIVEDRMICPAPAWVWWATALAGGLGATLAAAGLGGARGALSTGALAAALAAYYAVLAGEGLYLGFSAAAAVPAGYIGGAILRRLTTGRQRIRIRRMIAGRISTSQTRRVVAGLGEEVLRSIPDAAVLEIALEGDGGGKEGEPTVRRYVSVIKEAIFAYDGAALDVRGDIAGAFGWLATGRQVEWAAGAGLSMREKLKFVIEKLAAEGAGTAALRMGIGAGEGQLSAGKVSGQTLTGYGEAFERAGAAAREARRLSVGIVVASREAEELSAKHELRRLDEEGRYYEVLERKGALPVAMKKARELYEKALDEKKAGKRAEAKALLEEALRLADDGPSRALLAEMSGTEGNGRMK